MRFIIARAEIARHGPDRGIKTKPEQGLVFYTPLGTTDLVLDGARTKYLRG